MIRLTFSVLGDKQVDFAIQRFTEGVSDLTPAWEDIRDYFWQVEGELFDSEGSSGESGLWQPLSPQYAAWKAIHYGTPILERTGALRESLTGGDGSQVQISPMRLGIGSTVFYGIFHQMGTSKMPQRKAIDLTYENQQEIARAVQRHLVNLVRSNSGASL
jgi:phage gpG-like protein